MAGICSVIFAQPMALAQRKLAEKSFIPDHWNEVRPLTFRLWGIGVLILGIGHIFLW